MDINLFENKLKINGRTEDAVFFFPPEDHYGFLSNWYPSPFRLDGIGFSCNEQYMMYRKALTLGDSKTASAILATTVVAEQQTLGRQAAGYNAFLWEGQRQAVALRGILAKFSQNPELRAKLLATGDAWLVECLGKDKVWSCGQDLTDPARLDSSLWNGFNILGSALMEARALLK